VALFYDCADPQIRAGAISSAAHCVASGQLVVIPTDTVYGIGADAFDKAAVADLLLAKGRGRDMPVPVLVGSWNTIEGLTTGVDQRTRDLIEAFWPGGLTLIVEHAPTLTWDLGDARGTVAVRMPLHPVAIELLELTGPMAVSSANISGRPPAVTAQDARDQLGDSVAVYLDGGPAQAQIASTIVDVTAETPRIVRAGAVSLEELRSVVPDIADSTNGTDGTEGTDGAASTERPAAAS
jgi:tRNA threonylcarbamoyl adenosine modification protein (Sua5/YciO/YrdC/YwlC family)